MKVRVCYTTEVDNDYRRALRHAFGQHGTLATREEVREHLYKVGKSEDEDLMDEWLECSCSEAGQ